MGYIRERLRSWYVSGLVGLALGLLVSSFASDPVLIPDIPPDISNPVVYTNLTVSEPVTAEDLYLEEHRFTELEKYSEYEIEMLARVTYAEAGNQSEYGQRLVVDTILNRVDSSRFVQNDILSVLYAKNQFTCVSTGAIYLYSDWESCKDIVIEELCNRTNSDVIAFRTRYYHEWATPAFKEGDHYFSI